MKAILAGCSLIASVYCLGQTLPPIAPVNGECSVNVSPPVVIDAYSQPMTGSTTDPLTYTAQGSYTINWSFTDSEGDPQSATQQVNVADVTNPIVMGCPANISVFTSPTMCGANVSWGVPTITDNCSGLVVTNSHTPGSFFSTGTVLVNYTGTDIAGNMGVCSFNVTVIDNVAPIVPTLSPLSDECSLTVTPPTTTDNCTGLITATTSNPLTYSIQGTFFINWTFDDGNGNTSGFVQTIVIDDVTSPVPPTNLPNVTGECSATITGPAPTAIDACYGTITGTTSSPLSYSTQGTHVVTWLFVDGHGNTVTATQNVIVDDVTPPLTPVLPTLTGSCSVTATAPNTVDVCAGVITGTTTDPLVYSTQGTFTIHWTFNDGNGNSTTADQTVIIDDVTPPAINAPANITFIANAPGCTATGIALGTASSNDNCVGIPTITNDAPAVFNLGTTTVIWTATDAAGNSSTATQTVTITGPLSSSQDVTACDSYTAPNDLVYTISGTITVVLPSANGCDSTVTINLTIINSSEMEQDTTVCNSFTAADGTVYTTSGTYETIIPNAAGCDSIITTYLVVHTLNLDVTVMADPGTLAAVQDSVNYQWYNCDFEMNIDGATARSFVPDHSAYYAVILSDDICVDTTACTLIGPDLGFPEVFSPNDDGINDAFMIEGILDYPFCHLTVYNRWGNLVYEATGYQNNWKGTNELGLHIDGEDLPAGTYFYIIDMGESTQSLSGQTLKGNIFLTR